MKLLVLLWSCILLKVLDVGTTRYAISVAGISAEKNVIVRNAMEVYGPDIALIAILALHSLLVYLLYRRKGTKSLIFVTILLTAVVINNIFWVSLNAIG